MGNYADTQVVGYSVIVGAGLVVVGYTTLIATAFCNR